MSKTENLTRLNVAPIELRAKADGSEGSTLHGHFAVFNEWTEIHSYFEGDFLERLDPKSFDRTFEDRGDKVRVLYDHGHDPQIGNKPLGVPRSMASDKTGAAYEVDLFDTPYVNDLKPAIRAGQMGASFRFSVRSENWVEPKIATTWNPAKLPERTITDLDLYEFGPVTFPAYESATAGLRSTTDEFYDRIARDPVFLARFAERVGDGRVIAKVLTEAAPDGTAHTHLAPDGSRAVASGLLVASAKTKTLLRTRKGC